MFIPRYCSSTDRHTQKQNLASFLMLPRLFRNTAMYSSSVAAFISAPANIPRLPLLPPTNPPLTTFDRSVFSASLPTLALRIPSAKVHSISASFKKHFLYANNLRPIVPDPQCNTHRLVILPAQNKDDIFPALLHTIENDDQLSLVEYRLQIDYNFWTFDQIMKSILPIEILDESPTSYSLVGHIAHFNLIDDYLPYSNIIGQVLLEKTHGISTVVNKLDSISHEFRFFQMQLLSGNPDYNVTVSSEGCKFKFDFSKVYWNSRLSTEHSRLVDGIFDKFDCVVDAFAGVGPFAIPAAKKGCAVLASDLNPASASALEENVKLNKVDKLVRASCEDARTFIKRAVLDLWDNPMPEYSPPQSTRQQQKQAREKRRQQQQQQQQSQQPEQNNLNDNKQDRKTTGRRLVNHFVMNLPGNAIDFLDSFRGLYTQLIETREDFKLLYQQQENSSSNTTTPPPPSLKMPMVHCYCFATSTIIPTDNDNSNNDLDKSVKRKKELPRPLDDIQVEVFERAEIQLGLEKGYFQQHLKQEDNSNNALDDHTASVSFVRDVAPRKGMYRLSFRLPRCVAFEKVAL